MQTSELEEGNTDDIVRKITEIYSENEKLKKVDFTTAVLKIDQNRRRLGNISSVVVLFSVLIDISHVRAFPSYNISLGLWIWYTIHCLGRHKNAISKVIPVLSWLSIAQSCSIVTDIIFCSVWGNEITKGTSKSLKFSLILFIFNMFAKLPAIYFCAQIIYHIKCLK